MPWRVLEVTPALDFSLRVRFLDGTKGVVDMRALVHSTDAGVFAELADTRCFMQARVEHGAVVWPGELDLAPDAMYQAIKTSGSWVL